MINSRRETAADTVLDVWKIPTAKSAVKFPVKLSPSNMGFVNYFGLTFPQISRTQKSFLEVFYKSSCSTWLDTVVWSWKALHKSLLKIASVFQRISLKVQNSEIEKWVSIAASENNFILEIFLNGCFSKTAAKIYLS